MKVTLTIKVGKNAVLFELINVREEEYETLMHEVFDDPTEDKDYVYTFKFDGGLKEITFKPFFVESVYATRSEP